MENLRKYFFYIALFAVTAYLAVLDLGADNDIWHRMAVGSIYFQIGSVLRHDIFSYLSYKELWIDHEWGTGVLFYFLTHYLGDIGLIGMKILVLFFIILLIFLTNRLIAADKNPYRIIYYSVAAFAIVPGVVSNLRCQSVTYLLFTLWIYLLERVRKGENRLIWTFPATMLLWVNMHGGFVSGFGLLLIFIIGEFLNKKNPFKFISILALCLPVTLINPYGIKFLSYMSEAVTMSRPYITEWAPLNLINPINDWIGFKIILIITLIGYFNKYFILKDRKTDFVALIMLGFTLYLSLKHTRHNIFFVISASIYAYKYFYDAVSPVYNLIMSKVRQKFSDEKLDSLRLARESFIYMLVMLACTHIFLTKPMIIDLGSNIPSAKAIEFIKINNLRGNLLAPFNWGSYAMWKLYPQCLISVDGRYEEAYTNEVYLDVCNFTFAQKNWQDVLRKYHNDIILVESTTETFKRMKSLRRWKLVYQDKDAAVFLPAGYKAKEFLMPDRAK